MRSVLPAVLVFCTTLSSLWSNWERLDDCRLIDASSNDGDSFLIEYEGKRYRIRLYFVDSPEKGLFFPERVKQQAIYFDSHQEQILEIGKLASSFTSAFLSETFTVFTQWHSGGGDDESYLAIVTDQNGASLIEALVQNGLARIKGYQPGKTWPGGINARNYVNLLEELESQARISKVGAWMEGKGNWTQSYADEASKPSIGKNDLQVCVNTASKHELTLVPGIGHFIANRIIERRPFGDLDQLLEVKGIGPGSFEKMRSSLVLIEPMLLNLGMAEFYKTRAGEWANRKVELSVVSLEPLDVESPEGLVAFKAMTEVNGIPGGSIGLYLKHDFKDFVQSYFENASEPLNLPVYFFHYEGEWVAMHRK
ncbi:MAG: helix-hairpin-helix domain-containing protein [Opitutales bacterium]|nr:helix-hairpin-helix domain-containing protein [Opitutales bacterium]